MDIKELEEDEGRGIQTVSSPKCGHKAPHRTGARMGIGGSRKLSLVANTWEALSRCAYCCPHNESWKGDLGLGGERPEVINTHICTPFS